MSKSKFVVGLLIVAMVLSVYPAVFAQGDGPTVQVPDSVLQEIASAKSGSSLYIVFMGGDPITAYEGTIDGYRATKPGRGKVNPNSAHVRKYGAYLESSHNAALQAVGASATDKLYDYTFAADGFAASLTGAQAAALALQPGVLAVMPDEISYIQTDNTPDFLGLTDPAGPWAKGYDGEDVIIGVIDTGIWPEHPSFADDGSYGPAPAGWTGTGCDFGNAFNPLDAPFTCNNKLLAAKSYGLGFHGGTGIGLDPNEYLSARDADGHGSHTSSTAGGNSGVAASIFGISRGTVSGIAPRARISMYKACWSNTPTSGGCSGVDLVAAIDQAVADGVDVINYSIGSTSPALGSDDISFLFAEAAGVFIATSAGNSGPGASTVGSPATVPWVTSVGASTQDRTFQGSVTVDGLGTFFGASVTGGTASSIDIVDAATLGDELCNPGALAAAVGKIVLCKRGAIARVSKSLAVSIAGGAGMILYNAADTQTQNTDNHYVPSVHINNTDGVAIKTFINIPANMPASATIAGGSAAPAQGSVMASFSSRGPDRLAEDIIKPDVTAPGVNVLAANSPTALLGAPGQLFQSIGGTSMSSPHVAGTFALLKQAHPDWSPAMAKSALMTTARQDVLKEDGLTAADPFDMGAGHIVPGGKWIKGSVNEPGLVYDAGLFEYAGFTCGANLGVFSPGTCAFLAPLVPFDPSDLNMASIGVAELVGSQTVRRTVTSVAPGKRTFNVSVSAPAGFSVSVSPSSLTLKNGDSASYDVTITNTSATLGAWSFGSLTWNDTTGHYDVYSPIAVRAFQFAGPAEVSGSGASTSVNVQFGYTGDYSAGAHGLVAATQTAGGVLDDPANNINTALGCWFGTGGSLTTNGNPACGLTLHLVSVAAGSDYARFSLFDAFTSGSDDLDMYVWHPSGGFAGQSGSGTSAEQVDVAFPQTGSYSVFVHGWQTDAGLPATYTLFSWDPGADAGNMTISGAPATVNPGDTASLSVSFSGLAGATKYLGVISHHDTVASSHGPGPNVIGQTVVSVDTP